MRGKTEDEVRAELTAAGLLGRERSSALAPHKVFPGNRPSTTIMYRKLDPRTLGMLLALYEHKVFMMGAVWGINSFDQWGVELGKVLAGRIRPELDAGRRTSRRTTAPTNGLIDHARRLRVGRRTACSARAVTFAGVRPFDYTDGFWIRRWPRRVTRGSTTRP